MEETEQFPVGIDDLYANTVTRIEREPQRRQALAKRALVWLLNVRGTFSIEDLRHAVAVSPNTYSFEPRRIVSGDLLVSVCHGLAVFDEQSQQVRLVRESTPLPPTIYSH